MDNNGVFGIEFCCSLLYNGRNNQKETEIILNNQNETKTIDYYIENSNDFYMSTVSVAFSDIQNNFIKYLPKNAYILDFGCGSGRDSKAFLEKGYKVEAMDGSKEMCSLAEQ